MTHCNRHISSIPQGAEGFARRNPPLLPSAVVEEAARYILLPAQQKEGRDFVSHLLKVRKTTNGIQGAKACFGTEALGLAFPRFAYAPPSPARMAAVRWMDRPSSERSREAMQAFEDSQGMKPGTLCDYVTLSGEPVGAWSDAMVAAFRSMAGLAALQHATEAVPGGAPPHPARLDDPGHPDHDLYLAARGKIPHACREYGPMADEQYDRIAASLAVAARISGMSRIDVAVCGNESLHRTVWGGQQSAAGAPRYAATCMVRILDTRDVTMEQIGAKWPQAMEEFHKYEGWLRDLPLQQ